MPTSTTAAVARAGADDFTWEPLVLDDPGPGEALIRLIATGLCHTDLSVLAGNLPTPCPQSWATRARESSKRSVPEPLACALATGS